MVVALPVAGELSFAHQPAGRWVQRLRVHPAAWRAEFANESRGQSGWWLPVGVLELTPLIMHCYCVLIYSAAMEWNRVVRRSRGGAEIMNDLRGLNGMLALAGGPAGALWLIVDY